MLMVRSPRLRPCLAARSSVQRLLTLSGSSRFGGRVVAVGVVSRSCARRARIFSTRLSTRCWAPCETCPAVRVCSVSLGLRAMTAPLLPALDRVAANSGRCQRRCASLLDAGCRNRGGDADPGAPRACARRAPGRARRRCPGPGGDTAAQLFDDGSTVALAPSSAAGVSFGDVPSSAPADECRAAVAPVAPGPRSGGTRRAGRRGRRRRPARWRCGKEALPDVRYAPACVG